MSFEFSAFNGQLSTTIKAVKLYTDCSILTKQYFNRQNNKLRHISKNIT